MGLIYAEQVEYMSFEQMQQTHESEIKILNEIDKLAIRYERGDAELEELENKEMAELLEKTIKKLKPKYRKVLYLYYYKGLSRKEVAQKLEISPRRVSERVDYAQKLLRKLIKN